MSDASGDQSLQDRKSEGEGSNKGLVAAILLALASSIIAYAVNFVTEHRNAEIKEVNMQIEKLYGPLYAYSVANQRAWSELHGRYRNRLYYFDDNDMPDAQLVEIWRRWIRNVFMPINLKMETAIVENSQLLEGNKIYPSFVDFIAHVEAYKATIAKWKDADNLEDKSNRTVMTNTSVIVYPTNFDTCVEKRLRSVLLRKKTLEDSWIGYIPKGTEYFEASCS